MGLDLDAPLRGTIIMRLLIPPRDVSPPFVCATSEMNSSIQPGVECVRLAEFSAFGPARREHAVPSRPSVTPAKRALPRAHYDGLKGGKRVESLRRYFHRGTY